MEWKCMQPIIDILFCFGVKICFQIRLFSSLGQVNSMHAAFFFWAPKTYVLQGWHGLEKYLSLEGFLEVLEN